MVGQDCPVHRVVATHVPILNSSQNDGEGNPSFYPGKFTLQGGVSAVMIAVKVCIDDRQSGLLTDSTNSTVGLYIHITCINEGVVFAPIQSTLLLESQLR